MLVLIGLAGAACPDLPARSASPMQKTYCNPINIDYGYCPNPNLVLQGMHRTTADPVILRFKGDYYLFSTNQSGYWWSPDLARWNFVPRKFLKPHHQTYDEICAPAAFVLGDALYVIGSTYTHDFPLWKSANPRTDTWTEALPEFQAPAWDPAFLLDDDGRLYLYHGCSNTSPIYGQEVDAKTLRPVGERRELIRLHDDVHGWERFGEHNDNTFLRPFLEGPWMTKHHGKYYLQYAAPGTEFSGYADGVYVGDRPLGPFTYQAHNPVSFKPGGFARGAGHGATFQDEFGSYWHTATISIGVKQNFERRIGIWPAGFDPDGVMYCDTAYGDFPHYLPRAPGDAPLHSAFTGWMLLNYARPVTASSTLGGLLPNLAVDEDIRTYWSAASGKPGEWFQSDLGAVCTIRAIQVNYADQDAELLGKQPGLYHQYRVRASSDGRSWSTLIDKNENRTDVPHDYVELASPATARYLRIENVHVPTGKFALSGFRVFGHGPGPKPAPVKQLVALRGETDRRNAWLKWQASPNATGYVIYSGISPDKLYNSVMVFTANDYYFRAMDRTRPYYFQIEAFNEAGISERSPVVKAE